MKNKIIMSITIKPFNVIDRNELPEVTVDRIPVDGDPLEIDREMYFVCDTNSPQNLVIRKIGVIPLIIKNPKKVKNIESYLRYLSIAQRRIQYMDNNSI